MKTIAFLLDLRALLRSPASWHPLACANCRGRILGEYEQLAPTPTREVPTESVPAAWNLPCAITYLLQVWEAEGRFADPVVERLATRDAVWAVLTEAAGVPDLWFITEHAAARRAIAGALDGAVQTRGAA